MIRGGAPRKKALPTWPDWDWADEQAAMSDRERIKRNTEAYASMTVSEAFSLAYPEEVIYTPAPEGHTWLSDLIPADLKSGDRVRARLKSVTKDRTVLEVVNSKAEVRSVTNLWLWPRFRQWAQEGGEEMYLEVQVTEVKDGKVNVDPLAPIFEDWVNKILQKGAQRKWGYFDGTVTVHDLHQASPAGFTGWTSIRPLEEFLGGEYRMDVFIPSSHMILNISKDLSEFEGSFTEAFVLNYSAPTKWRPASLVCSRKDWLRHLGDQAMIEMFREWCEGSQLWKQEESLKRDGMVTGIINSSKKCGVFVEIPQLCLTGMIPLPPEKLVEFAPFQEVKVSISKFEEDVQWNGFADQMQHNPPYVIEDGLLKEVNIKPVFTLC